MGELIALGCALIWSLAVICFKIVGEDAHPIILNFCKNWLGAILLVPTVLLIDGPMQVMPNYGSLALLIVSGFIGIGVADYFVLRGLAKINASRFAIVECAYSPAVILLSVLFLGESFGIYRFFGASLVLLAIVLVSIKPDPASGPLSKEGFLYCIAGIFSMAVGIVMIKPIFDEIPLFWIIQIRLAAGAVGSTFLLATVTNRREKLKAILLVERKVIFFLACFLSTYVSMILWVAGYKYNDATVAAVLNQTATIFTVLLAAMFLKERLNIRSVIATALAVVGVLIMSYY